MDPESIQDLFQELGPVRVRSMFGGKGLYVDEQIFGLEAGGEIYLKTDTISRTAFEAAGSRPFTYEKAGEPVATSYWLLPSAASDDPSEAARWARMALEAARRAGASKARKKKR